MVLIKDVIDFDAVAEMLVPQLTTMSLDQIKNEFANWFWGIQDSEFVFYSQAQVIEHIELLKEKFLEEYYIYPYVVASQLGMEVISA